MGEGVGHVKGALLRDSFLNILFVIPSLGK